MFDLCPAARMQAQIHVMILCFDVHRRLISHEASLNLLGQESFLGLSSFLTPSSWQFGQQCELRPESYAISHRSVHQKLCLFSSQEKHILVKGLILVIKLSNPFETVRLRCVKSTWNLYVRTSLNWVLMGAGTQFIGVVVPRMSVQ